MVSCVWCVDGLDMIQPCRFSSGDSADLFSLSSKISRGGRAEEGVSSHGRITECLGLEGTSVGLLVQPPC